MIALDHLRCCVASRGPNIAKPRRKSKTEVEREKKRLIVLGGFLI
jgi:hypothetical protein